MIWRGLVPAILACLLPACGGGDGDGGGDGIRPLSMNGVSLNFGGAQLTFTTSAPNASGTTTEIGGIFYERLNTAAVAFTPADSSALDGVELTWPLDLGGNARYEYTPIDGSTARLLIYPESTEDGTFFYGTGTDFDTIVITFTASGGTITGIQAVMTVNSSGGRYVAQFNPSGLVGVLSGSPRPLPAGWNGVNQGSAFIALKSFNGNVLTLNQEGGEVEIQFGPFIATGAVTTQSNSTTERGLVAILFTENLSMPGSETTRAYEADYLLTQPFGTENVLLQIAYRSGTAALPANETVTLLFTGGGKLSTGTGTVEIRSGTYFREDGTTGTFIIDTR